jgi:hypothetical protein
MLVSRPRFAALVPVRTQLRAPTVMVAPGLVMMCERWLVTGAVSPAYELVRSGDLKCIRLRRRIVVPVAHLAESLAVERDAVWATLHAGLVPASSPAAEPSGTTRVRRRSSATTEHPTLF